MSARRAAAPLVGAVVLLAGCGEPGYDSASAALRTAQGDVTDAVLHVAGVLQGAGLGVTDLRGGRVGCSSAPRSGVGYRIGGSVTGGRPLSDRLDATLAALRADGWTVASVRRDAPRPAAMLTRDGRRLVVVRTTRQGSRDLTFSSVSRCVPFPDDRIPDLSRVDTVPVPP